MKPARLAILAPLLLASCYVGVYVDSDPRGAMLKVNGERIGKTPLIVNFKDSWFTYSYFLEAETDGGDYAAFKMRKQFLSGWPGIVLLKPAPRASGSGESGKVSAAAAAKD